MLIQLTRQEKFVAVSVLIHAVLLAVVLRVPPRPPQQPKERKEGIVLMLSKAPGPERDQAPLQFQKPGPETVGRQAGLPPAPPPSPAPAFSPGPPGEASPVEVASATLADGVPPPAAAVLQQRPSSSSGTARDNPFTASLADLQRPAPRGGARGDGNGMPSSPFSSRPQLSGDASFAYDSGGFDLSEWAELVKLKVQSNWIVPTAAQMGMKGVVSIDLVVELDGRLSYCEVSSSCGIVSMDSAAFNALRSSVPFPSFPPGFPRQNLPARFAFFYNMERRH